MSSVPSLPPFTPFSTLSALSALSALAITVVVASRSTLADVGHDSTLGHRAPSVKKLADACR
jgi:hypothetical protein